MVTMQQIAEACGVSRGTVDRALHNKPGIRPEVAARIQEKAREMGYISARLMPAMLKTWKIGVVLHSGSSGFVRNLAALFENLPDKDLLPVQIILRTMDGVDIQHQLALIDELVDIEQIDGLALMPLANSQIRDKINELSEKKGIPVVTLNTDISDANRIAYIGPDNIASGRSAAGLMGLVTAGAGHILPILGQQSGHYADSQRLTAMAEMEIISLLQVATSTKIFMHIEIVVLHDSRHRNGSGILKGLCLLVVTANHHRLWRKVQMFVPYPTFIHNLLAFSVDDNLRQLIFQLLTLEDRSIYQLGIGRKVKRIEVEIHRYRQSVILLRHLHIANLNLVGSQLYFMAVLCHNSCRSHQ